MISKISKKVYGIFMSMLMIFSSVSSTALVFAADTSTSSITLKSDAESVNAGDEITLNVGITENSKIVDFEGTITYDSDMLEYVPNLDEYGTFQGFKGNLIGNYGWATTTPNATVAGKVKVVGTSQNGEAGAIKKEGTLFSLKFKVKDTAKGKISFDLAEGATIDTVDASGNLSAFSYTVENTVNAYVPIKLQSISLNKDKIEVEVGKTSDKLEVTYNPADTTDSKVVTWKIADEKIATVNNGVVTGVKGGNTTLTAKVGNVEKTIPVSVIVPLKGISVQSELALEKGGASKKLGVTYNPNDTTENPTLVWTSSNEAIAKVDSNGNVTPVGKGSADITVKTSDNRFSATCKVSVSVPVNSVSIDKNVTLEIGGTSSKDITATINPSDAIDDDVNVVFQSSDNGIVKLQRVDNKTVKLVAVSNGSAVVTASFGGKMATCNVKVVTPVKSLSFGKTTAEIYPAQVDKLTLTYNPTTTTQKDVVYTSSDETIATVDQNGNVTAKRPGTVTIKATSKENSSVSASCVYTVKPIPVNGVVISSKTETLNKGQTKMLTATVKPDNTTDEKSVTWTSSNENVAKVDANGKVTAVGKGSATIKATSTANSTYFDTCIVEVLVPLTGISIDKTTIDLTRDVVGNDTANLVVSKLPADTTNNSVVKFKSSNESVVTVDANGKITAVGKGTATITASVDGFEKTCEVKVTVPLKSFTINEQDKEIYLKQTQALTLKLNPTDTSIDASKATWSSSDEKIATVDANGKVTAIAEGTVTITATLDSKTATTVITCKRLPLNSIFIKQNDPSMRVGSNLTLEVGYEPENTTDVLDVIWKSSDEAIATVDANGKVTAIAEGTATITAISKANTSLMAAVDVEVFAVHISDVSIDKSEISKADLKVGGTYELNYNVNPSDVTDEYSYLWVSSDEKIATIDENGKITALSEGKVKFTLYIVDENDNEFSDTVELYVAPEEVKEVESPDTSDINMVAILGTMVVSLAGMAFISRRKKDLLK